jgi:hypothetical protein
MSTYRYLTTAVRSGTLLAESIPLHVGRFARALGNAGQPRQLDASLDLGVLPAVTQAAYLAALEPCRSMLWVLQDELPVWAGIIWDWPVTSGASGKLPIQATEIGSLFARRQIRTDRVFAGADLFAVVQGLLNYAVGKTYGEVGNLAVGTAVSGTSATITFPAANLSKVADAVSQFCAQYGVEYAFTPGWNATATTPVINLQLGYPTLGRAVASTNLQLLYPSEFVLDYAYARMGSNSVNDLLATAPNAGTTPWQSAAPHGRYTTDLTTGYPLLEDSTAYTAAAVTTQAQIDAYADGRLSAVKGRPTVPSVTIGGGGTPTVGQLQLGDEAMLVATSPLHPAAGTAMEPGLQQLVRIIGWEVTPPADGQTESTKVLLGGVTS